MLLWASLLNTESSKRGKEGTSSFPLQSMVASFRAVLWRPEWELDFWLGKPAASFPLFTWQRCRMLEPLGFAASLIYRGLQDEHKVSAVPTGPKVTVLEMRFIECFQQLHWLQRRKECLCPYANSSCCSFFP